VGMIPYFADALLPALYLLAFSLSIVTAIAIYDAKGSNFVAGVFGSFLAAGIVSVGIGLTQWLWLGLSFVEQGNRDGRIFANLMQPNHLASLLGLALAGVLWFYETRRIGALATWLALAFLGFGLVMTESHRMVGDRGDSPVVVEHALSAGASHHTGGGGRCIGRLCSGGAVVAPVE
jgi:hypothetical protein